MVLMAQQDKCCGLLEIFTNGYHSVQLVVFLPCVCLSYTLTLTHTHSHLSPFEVTRHKEALVLGLQYSFVSFATVDGSTLNNPVAQRWPWKDCWFKDWWHVESSAGEGCISDFIILYVPIHCFFSLFIHFAAKTELETQEKELADTQKMWGLSLSLKVSPQLKNECSHICSISWGLFSSVTAVIRSEYESKGATG